MFFKSMCRKIEFQIRLLPEIPESLLNKDCCGLSFRNRVDKRMEAVMVQHAVDYPAHGQGAPSKIYRT